MLVRGTPGANICQMTSVIDGLNIRAIREKASHYSLIKQDVITHPLLTFSPWSPIICQQKPSLSLVFVCFSTWVIGIFRCKTVDGNDSLLLLWKLWSCPMMSCPKPAMLYHKGPSFIRRLWYINFDFYSFPPFVWITDELFRQRIILRNTPIPMFSGLLNSLVQFMKIMNP